MENSSQTTLSESSRVLLLELLEYRGFYGMEHRILGLDILPKDIESVLSELLNTSDPDRAALLIHTRLGNVEKVKELQEWLKKKAKRRIGNNPMEDF